MGKKRGQRLQHQFPAYFLVLVCVALFYQNCSDVRVSGQMNQNSSVNPPASHSSDAYDYKSIDSSSMPAGGTEPGDWNVPGSDWFDNYTFGDPGFSSCSVFNMETQQMENKAITVVTGEEADVMITNDKGKKVPQHVKTLFELKGLLDFRFGDLGNNGITSFRIFVPPDTSAEQVTLDMHVCCAPNLMPQGVVVSLSRKLCDFREKNPSEKIYTREYCTIGNTVNAGMDIMNTFEAVSSPTGLKPCSIEPGYYYYLNVINGHFNFTSSSYLNGVISIRAN